jgi:hypothetical protein
VTGVNLRYVASMFSIHFLFFANLTYQKKQDAIQSQVLLVVLTK